MITTANRLEGIGEYYFSQKLREIEQLNKQGKKVINLGIGSPDLPPHPDVIKELQETSALSDTHAYQGYKGIPALRSAFSNWYQEWYGVTLDAESEILPLIGSKEGIMHICMTYLNEGDMALVPNPGYPTYRSAVKLAGGTCIDYKITGEEYAEIDFEELETVVQKYNTPIVSSGANTVKDGRIKLMWVNFPHMPTGKRAARGLFEKLIAFGKKYNMLICHDNPYSFILNSNPTSILSVEGAKDIAIELNSLSKSHNMAGWRLGVMVASARRINEVLRFKSNMDSGMFLPVQRAAVKALRLGNEWFTQINKIYGQRREKVFQLLDLLGCSYNTDQVGMFVWASIPAHEDSGFSFSDKILYSTGVFITPGGIFGNQGDQFIRVSLCSKPEVLDESIQRIKLFQEKIQIV
ncbi:MAG TPA: aminotransferase class I/II-fold pyridoxal phosphate-dependent enzyme [Parasegetibacter sp.]